MGAKKVEQKTTAEAEPWKEQQPYLKEAMSGAQGLYRAGFNPDQQAGMAGIRNMGSDPNSGFNRAKNYWQGALEGGPNDALFQNVQSKVLPAVNSMFSSAGRYGSGLHTDTATRGLTEAYAPTAQSQMNMAAGALPGMEAGQAQSLLGIGGMPQEALMQYLQGITGAGQYGKTTTIAPPIYQQNPLLGLVGPALGAVGTVMGGPIGGMIGSGMGSMFAPASNGAGLMQMGRM